MWIMLATSTPTERDEAPFVPEEAFYKWRRENSSTPLTWIQIAVDNNIITGNNDPKTPKEMKTYNILYSPPGIAFVQDNDSSYYTAQEQSFPVQFKPITIAFCEMDSSNLHTGLQSLSRSQNLPKKPEVTITLSTISIPDLDGSSKTMSTLTCTDCIILGVNIVENTVHLRFAYGTIKREKKSGTGVIASQFDSVPAHK